MRNIWFSYKYVENSYKRRNFNDVSKRCYVKCQQGRKAHKLAENMNRSQVEFDNKSSNRMGKAKLKCKIASILSFSKASN